jgi:hypothetical protein
MQVWPRAVIATHRVAAAVLAIAAAGLAVAVSGRWWAAALGALVGGAYYLAFTRRYRRRRELARAPFPAAQRELLERSVPYYRRLGDEAKRRFELDVAIFMSEQTVTGIAGRAPSDEARLLIAASAAMLTHGLPDFEWPRVRDIVVYPRSFDANYDARGGDIAGMVHLRGPILFSQRDLRHGFQAARDGHHVGVHEMAHVMDMLDGSADGIPGDLPWVATAPWIDVVARGLRRVRAKHHPVLRAYAGTNEAELFAVAVEAFFERPDELAKRDRELFDMLARYFNQDPRRAKAPDQGSGAGGSSSALST